MANRFDNNEDFEFEDEFDDYTDIGADHIALPSDLQKFQKDIWSDAEQMKVNAIVLQKAIDMVSTTPFWRWRKMNTKLNMIISAYYALLDLVKEE